MAHKVFVYGTLRKGCIRNHVLAAENFLGATETEPEFSLLDLGPFPGLARGEGAVKGELYEVSDACLARLDRIEGHPWLFKREIIEVAGQEAWAYFYNTNTPEEEDTIPSGDWIEHAYGQVKAQES